MGNLPHSITFVLRLLILIESKAKQSKSSNKNNNDESLTQSVLRLLRQPFHSLGKESNDIQVQYHFRFALEILSEYGLINSQGQPIDLSGLVTHLFYIETVNFFILELLRSGILLEIANRKDEIL